MSFIAAAIVGGSTLLGGLFSSKGSKSAAQTQSNSANYAADIANNQYKDTVSRMAPYTQSGYGAQNSLNYLLGIPGSDGNTASAVPGRATWQQGMPGYSADTTQPGGMGFGSLLQPFDTNTFQQMSPAYRFQLQQGMQGVVNGDTSSQGALSGATQKDLIDYNQNSANTAFNNAFNQYQAQQGNIYSRLAGVASLGENAGVNVGQQGTALAGSAAQSVTNAGTAAAAGQIGSANAWSSALTNSAPWFASMANNNGGNTAVWP